jgi:hypothetical protein
VANMSKMIFRCRLCRTRELFGQNEMVLHLDGVHKVDMSIQNDGMSAALMSTFYDSFDYDEVKQK